MPTVTAPGTLPLLGALNFAELRMSASGTKRTFLRVNTKKERGCALQDAARYQKVVQLPSVSAGASFFTTTGTDTLACRVAAG